MRLVLVLLVFFAVGNVRSQSDTSYIGPVSQVILFNYQGLACPTNAWLTYRNTALKAIGDTYFKVTYILSSIKKKYAAISVDSTNQALIAAYLTSLSNKVNDVVISLNTLRSSFSTLDGSFKSAIDALSSALFVHTVNAIIGNYQYKKYCIRNITAEVRNVFITMSKGMQECTNRTFDMFVPNSELLFGFSSGLDKISELQNCNGAKQCVSTFALGLKNNFETISQRFQNAIILMNDTAIRVPNFVNSCVQKVTDQSWVNVDRAVVAKKACDSCNTCSNQYSVNYTGPIISDLYCDITNMNDLTVMSGAFKNGSAAIVALNKIWATYKEHTMTKIAFVDSNRVLVYTNIYTMYQNVWGQWHFLDIHDLVFSYRSKISSIAYWAIKPQTDMVTGIINQMNEYYRNETDDVIMSTILTYANKLIHNWKNEKCSRGILKLIFDGGVRAVNYFDWTAGDEITVSRISTYFTGAYEIWLNKSLEIYSLLNGTYANSTAAKKNDTLKKFMTLYNNLGPTTAALQYQYNLISRELSDMGTTLYKRLSQMYHSGALARAKGTIDSIPDYYTTFNCSA